MCKINCEAPIDPGFRNSTGRGQQMDGMRGKAPPPFDPADEFKSCSSYQKLMLNSLVWVPDGAQLCHCETM